MMSELKTPEGIFLDLIYLAEIGTSYMGKKIPESIFMDYLKLSGSYEKLKQEINQKFEGITKERFQDEFPSESWPDIDQKLEVFNRKLKQFESDDDCMSNYHQYEDEFIKNAYQYYRYCTGHKVGLPISTKAISDRDSAYMVNMMKSIGEDILLKDTLQEVQDHLEFNDIYSTVEHSPDDLQLYARVADACWKFYEDNNSITREELLYKIEHKCRFKKYSQLSAEEAKSKALESAKQWVRDVKNSSGIIISK